MKIKKVYDSYHDFHEKDKERKEKLVALVFWSDCAGGESLFEKEFPGRG